MSLTGQKLCSGLNKITRIKRSEPMTMEDRKDIKRLLFEDSFQDIEDLAMALLPRKISANDEQKQHRP